MGEYRLKLSNRRLKIVENNLNDLNQFKSYFGEKWFDEEMNVDDSHHPILFLLFDKTSASDLIDKLKTLEFKCVKFKSIIKKLKSDRDFNNFNSTLTEIDVISHYYQEYKPDLIEYEPSVQNGKKLDLRMNIDNEDYFFEILSIFEDSKQQKDNYICWIITQELEDTNLPFTIYLLIKESFKEEYISKFVDFIKEGIKQNNVKNTNSKLEFLEFYNDDTLVAEYRYEHNGEGCIVCPLSPARIINPHGRLKSKVLKKAIKQIPNNQNNIVVVNLSDYLNFFLPIEWALGEPGIKIYRNNLNDKYYKNYYRIPNGIFDYEHSSHISMIIAYINNDYSQRKFYLNHELDSLSRKKLINNLRLL